MSSNLFKLCKSTDGKRTHYVKCVNPGTFFGEEFLCETSNGFIQHLINKQILNVDETFNINDQTLLTKIKKQKNILTIENFDKFCDVYGFPVRYNFGEIEKFFDDTVINNTFYGLTNNTKFKKTKFKNFEKRTFYITVKGDNFKNNYSRYSGWINTHDNYTSLKIICINNKLFCEELFWIFIPRQIHIDNEKKCFFFGGREYDFIGYPEHYSKYTDGYNFKVEYLYESGKHPWSSQINYNSYFENLNKFEINDFFCLNPPGSLDLFNNFKNN